MNRSLKTHVREISKENQCYNSRSGKSPKQYRNHRNCIQQLPNLQGKTPATVSVSITCHLTGISAVFLTRSHHARVPSEQEREICSQSTSLLHGECCCISLGMRFIMASKQESCTNHTGGHAYTACAQGATKQTK